MRKISPKKLAISQEEYGFAVAGDRRKILRHQQMWRQRIDPPISGPVYREGLIASKVSHIFIRALKRAFSAG
jgi:hypothetical protein